MADELWDDASSEWITLPEMDGRHLLVFPKEIKKLDKKGKVPAGEDPQYEVLFCDLYILSGELTDKIDEIPLFVEKAQFTSGPIRSQGQKTIGKAKRADKPFGTFAGTMNSWPAKQHGPNARSYAIGPWTDSVKDEAELAELKSMAEKCLAEYTKFRQDKALASVDTAVDSVF